MKKFFAVAALSALLLFAGPVRAQEQEKEAAKSGAMAEPDPLLKWANFGILVLGLGFLAFKAFPPLFRSRTEEIQKGIAEAQKMKQDADARAHAVNARMQTLSTEIEQFRTQAKAEMQQEGERLRQETANQMARLQQQAAQEIDSAGKTARRALKAHAANLALQLAEQKLRSQPGAGAGLVDGFIQDLSKQVSSQTTSFRSPLARDNTPQR